MKKEFRVVSNHEVYEDSYENGELQYVNGYTLDGIYKVDSWQQAVEKHFNENGLSIDIKDCEIEDNILYTSCMVNFDGVQPFDNEIQDFKKGLINLYSDNITVTVQELVDVKLN